MKIFRFTLYEQDDDCPIVFCPACDFPFTFHNLRQHLKAKREEEAHKEWIKKNKWNWNSTMIPKS